MRGCGKRPATHVHHAHQPDARHALLLQARGDERDRHDNARVQRDIHQWQRCATACTNIAAAIGTSYLLLPVDVDKKIRVLVSANNILGAAVASSDQLGPVAPSTAQIKTALLRMLKPYGNSARLGAVVRNGGYRCTFVAPGAGRLAISWYTLAKSARNRTHKLLIATAQLHVPGAKTATVTVKLTAAGKTLLKLSHRVHITATGTFTPEHHNGANASSGFTLAR